MLPDSETLPLLIAVGIGLLGACVWLLWPG